MTDIIKEAKALAALKVPHMRAEVSVSEDEDPRHADDCLVQIIEKDDSSSIWYEEEHGGYEYGELHYAHVFAAAPELAETVAEETYLYGVQVWVDEQWVMMFTSNYGTDLIHRGRWFAHKHEAEDFAERWNRDTSTRIVRRRVSEPEVME